MATHLRHGQEADRVESGIDLDSIIFWQKACYSESTTELHLTLAGAPEVIVVDGEFAEALLPLLRERVCLTITPPKKK